MKNSDPYQDADTSKWSQITEELIKQHPLSKKELVDVCLESWNQIFTSKIGGIIQIGEDIAITPQMIGNFLHVLIAHNLTSKFPKKWRIEQSTADKDIVYIPDEYYSFEIKTSSSKNDIYGNRSFGQKMSTENGKKTKDGYYLSVNFVKPVKGEDSVITKIKFGWIDHRDWIAQTSSTGQQSRLTPEAKKFKLIVLYSLEKAAPIDEPV